MDGSTCARSSALPMSEIILLEIRSQGSPAQSQPAQEVSLNGATHRRDRR